MATQGTEESFDHLECQKCGQTFEQILALECQHNLCLNCSSQNLLNNQKFKDKSQQNSIQCEICGVITVLDPESVQILQEMGQEQQFNEQQQQQQENMDSPLSQNQKYQEQQQQQQYENPNLQIQQDYYQDNDNNQNSQQQQQQQQQYQQQQQQEQSPQTYIDDQNQSNNKQQFQQQQQVINGNESFARFDQSPFNQHQQQQQQFQNQNYYNQQQQNSSQLQASMFQQQGPEENILFCFTCECPCFSVESYLSGLHKNCEVGNVRKRYEDLQNSVDDLRFKVKTRCDLLLNDESRLTQKKREIVETVSQAKTQIKQSFDELLRIVEQKQQQLLQATEELMEDKFMELDRCLAKVQNQTDMLQNFDRELERVYYKQDRSSQGNDIRAFNFYAENKQRMLLNLQNLDQNFFTSIKERMHCEFQLDMNSVYQHLESVKNVKMEVMALKGLESATPSQLEIELYEQAKLQKQQRKIDRFTQGGGIINQSLQQNPQKVLENSQNKEKLDQDSVYMDYINEKNKIQNQNSRLPPKKTVFQESLQQASQQQQQNQQQSQVLTQESKILQQSQSKHMPILYEDSMESQQQQTKSNFEKIKQSIAGGSASQQKGGKNSVSEQLEELKKQIGNNGNQSSSSKLKENDTRGGNSTLDKINALRSRFQSK